MDAILVSSSLKGAQMAITILQASEGFNAICKLAKARSVADHSLSRRIADEAEVVRLYRAAVYGGDGRQRDLGGDGLHNDKPAYLAQQLTLTPAN